MLERGRLRKADAFTALLVAGFGIWIIFEALKMPLKDSWGGVKSVWYVSPALMPLIVGGFLILLSIMLFWNAVKEVGFAELTATGKRVLGRTKNLFHPTVTTLRFYVICALLLLWVFLYMPRVDFLLNSILFLLVFTGMFHFEDDGALSRIFTFFGIGSVLFLLYFATGLGGLAGRVFSFSADVLLLLFIIALCVFLSKVAGKDAVRQKKLTMVYIISILSPLVICPLFKFGFKVPLPYEGGILRLMDLIKYRLF